MPRKITDFFQDLHTGHVSKDHDRFILIALFTCSPESNKKDKYILKNTYTELCKGNII